MIVTFELDDEIKMLNPICYKYIYKPTVWADNVHGDNTIRFQVVTNSNNDSLSGAYTYDNQFTYYDTNNVVLNITQETPLVLNTGSKFNFTLMDVSEDNLDKFGN